MHDSLTIARRSRPTFPASQGEPVAVDLDDVVERLVEYVRGRAHAAGARAWADSLTPDHNDYRLARIRAIEAGDVAAAQLHTLALALFPDLDDVLAHEQLVDDIDDALKAGWLAGFDGQPANDLVEGFTDDDVYDETSCADCLALGAELCPRCAQLVYAAAGVEPPHLGRVDDDEPVRTIVLERMDGSVQHVDVTAVQHVDVRGDLL